MEIASRNAINLRRAKRDDFLKLSRLMETAAFRHHHADWFSPSDWLEIPSFIVATTTSGREMEIIGCLAVTADVLPVAWVRLAVVEHRNQGELLDEMLNQVLPDLKRAGVKMVAWLDSAGWPDNMIRNTGFAISNWIITLQSDLAEFSSPDVPEVIVRKALISDLSTLTDIERRAFEPLWQLNEKTLERALEQSYSFDVAVVGQHPVGFQFSTLTRREQSAHLVRITVDPRYQQRGVGTKLLANLMRNFSQQGIQQISLNTQINNVGSHRLYRKFGFQRVGIDVPLYTLQLELEVAHGEKDVN